MDERPALSVVIPVYNEEESLPRLYDQLLAVLEPLGRPYEIIFVDDGSRDSSFSLLRGFAAANPRVRAIQFRRNFGQTAALAAGIDYSRGDVLVFLDADLQNDPHDIPRLLARLDEGFDVVSGWRRNRHDAAVTRKIPSRAANWLISQVTGVKLNDYGCTLKAYRREVLENVRLYGEMHRFIPAYAAWAGANITELPVNHRPRSYGKSKYGLNRTIKVLLDLITVKFLGSYSTKPIYVFGGLGVALMGLAGLDLLYVLFQFIALNIELNRNVVLLLLAVFFAIVGIQSIMMGLLAELITRTYHESQGKPTYVIREILNGPGGATSRNGLPRPAESAK